MIDDEAMLEQVEHLSPTIHTPMGWGKHKARSYIDVCRIDPGYMKWAATTLGGMRGRLAAEALALYLEVPE